MNALPIDIQDLVRLQDTKRWTVVNTARQQSVAEHTMLVTFIAIDIATRMGIPFNSPEMTEVTLCALLHDVDEVYTGDLPTPAKARLGTKAKASLSQYADSQGASKQAKSVVKMADIIETTWFIGQYASGIHAEQVADEMVRDLDRFMESLPGREWLAMTGTLSALRNGIRQW